jgi:hypothetical protein
MSKNPTWQEVNAVLTKIYNKYAIPATNERHELMHAELREGIKALYHTAINAPIGQVRRSPHTGIRYVKCPNAWFPIASEHAYGPLISEEVEDFPVIGMVPE